MPRAGEEPAGGRSRGLVDAGRREGLGLDGQQASLCRLREACLGHSTREQEACTPRAQAQRRAGTCLPFGRGLSRVEP